MAIAKKPKSHTLANRFIEGAGKEVSKAHRIPTTLRFDPALLLRIDSAAKRRGISRSAWIQYTLSRALDEENGG